MLFDPNYPDKSSGWPLLYKPFAVSKEARNSIIEIARQSQKKNKIDYKKFLLDSVELGGAVRDRKYRGSKSKETKMEKFLSKFLKRGSRGSSIGFEKQLMEQAYDDLIDRVDGRDFLSRYQLYSPRRDELILNDFMDPSLLLMEDLENRDYGIKLYRIAAPSGAYRRTGDGLDDCVVGLADQKARDLLDKLIWGEPMSILNELYRGRGVFYPRYVEHVFRDTKLDSSWERSSFSEEERNRLISFAIQKEISDDESNFALSKRTPSLEDREYWKKSRAKVRDLNVEPADQIFLRGVIARLVDRTPV